MTVLVKDYSMFGDQMPYLTTDQIHEAFGDLRGYRNAATKHDRVKGKTVTNVVYVEPPFAIRRNSTAYQLIRIAFGKAHKIATSRSFEKLKAKIDHNSIPPLPKHYFKDELINLAIKKHAVQPHGTKKNSTKPSNTLRRTSVRHDMIKLDRFRPYVRELVVIDKFGKIHPIQKPSENVYFLIDLHSTYCRCLLVDPDVTHFMNVDRDHTMILQLNKNCGAAKSMYQLHRTIIKKLVDHYLEKKVNGR